MNAAKPAAQPSRRILMALAAGAAAGVVGWQIGRLLKAGGMLDLSRWTWADATAMAVAAGMLVLGLGITIRSFGQGLAPVIDPTGRRPATPAQRSYFRLQAAVLLLAGLCMATPPAADALFGPLPAALGASAMALVAALFLLQTVFNLMLWMRSDELVRQITAESGAATFWTLQAALFLWAAGERLGVAPPVDAWSLAVLMMAGFLLISSIVSIRRGAGA